MCYNGNMAQYKVPQDVEADDKLLGPFSFRQFVYLLIAGGLIALSVGLFQLFPLLAIIPVPFVLLLAALALPLKKDQPMETYLAAIVSYYLKPRTRIWIPGQRETTINIIAPKQKNDDETRTRDITGEEATHRLSFLADIVDTEGYAIKGAGVRRIDDTLALEANANDMFETNHFDNLESTIAQDENEQRMKVMQQMREVISQSERMDGATVVKRTGSSTTTDSLVSGPNFESSAVVMPGSEVKEEPMEKSNVVPEKPDKNVQKVENSSIIELANNPDYTIATISKEAKRIKERDEGEVFISLH